MEQIKTLLKIYRSQIQKGLLGPAILLLLLPIVLFTSRPDNRLKIYFFNVGQGDSIFIKTPQNYQILIDGGPSDQVIWELSKVMPFYDRSLDLVVLTHPHADHVDGLIEVLKRFRVSKILINNISYDSPDYRLFWRVLTEKKIPHEQFLAGDSLNLPDGVLMESFWPKNQTDIFEVLDVNRASIVFKLSWKGFSALLTGDAELGDENPELADLNWGKVDVLKVPHHGSKGALTQKSLSKLKPAIAVIMVGKNRFGHPAKEWIKLLQKSGAKVLRTDVQGTIEVISDGQVWTVK